MKECQENEFETFSIDPSSWHNIPKPLTQSIDFLLTSLNSQSFQIKSLKKELKLLTASQSHSSSSINSLQNILEKKLQLITDDLQVSFLTKTSNLSSSFEVLSTDYSESKQQLISLQKQFELAFSKENLNNNKESLKAEIFSKQLKPELDKIKFENCEVLKSLAALEKQARSLSHKSEKNYEETISKIETQKVEINSVKNAIGSILTQFESIADSKSESLHNQILSYESLFKESYSTFENSKQAFFQDLSQKETALQQLLDEKTRDWSDQSSDLIKAKESLLKSNEELQYKVEKLEETFKFESEKIRIQTEKHILDSYKKAKEKLIYTYREDVKLLKQKLEWLPQELETIKDLAPIEARLYTLESRLKREETNRIVQKIDLLKGEGYIDIEEKVYGTGSRDRSVPSIGIEMKTPTHRFQIHSFKSINRRKNITPEYIHTGINSLGKYLN